MEILNHIHSIVRWLLLVTIILTIVKSRQSISNSLSFSSNTKKVALIAMSLAHLQLVIGLAQYFFGARGLKNIQSRGMKEVMSSGVDRFFAVEHITTMLIAIVLITIGYSKAKRKTDQVKANKTVFGFYVAALILILVSIPWPFMEKFKGAVGWF